MALANLALVASLSLACSSHPQLEPATAANSIDGDTVFASVEGVSIVAHTGSWAGNRDVLAFVTPLRVTVENRSDRPIRLQYRSFDLRAADGTRYRALPPFEIAGSVTNSMPVRFRHRGFHVDPLYHGMYTGLRSHGYGYPYDYDYYDQTRVYWNETLPTARMLERSLPEGVIEPGGMVEGFLYFQKVDRDEQRVWLHADLIGTESEQEIGSLEIPFRVEG